MQSVEIRSDARKHGQAHGPAACVEHAEALAAPCPRMMVGCATRANLFAYFCLEAVDVRRDAALCDGIPPSTDVFGTRDWMIERCGRRGRDEACGAIAATVQRYCFE